MMSSPSARHRHVRPLSAAALGMAALLCLPAAALARRVRAAPKAPAARASPPASPLARLAPEELLRRALAAYAGLEYDAVVPNVEELLMRPGLSVPMRLEAYRLLGSAQAIIADTVEAEKPFRLLLRLRPDYELPADTPPKILAAFRQVQGEERAVAEQVAAAQRQRIKQGLALFGGLPARAYGGYPIRLTFQLKDPTAAVERLQVSFRREGQRDFSTLALRRDALGRWQGLIPGEATVSRTAERLEYFIETLDAKAPLLTVGSAEGPLRLDLAPGTEVRAHPPPLPPWAVFTGAGVAGALGLAAGTSGLLLQRSQLDYAALVRSAQGGPVDAAAFQRTATLGGRYAAMSNGFMISAAAVALGTALAVPFTNWQRIPEPAATP